MSRIRGRFRDRVGNITPWYQSQSLKLNSIEPSLVHQYDKGRYYNTASGPTSFPFTATRTTSATMFDSSGQMVWGAHQLCPRGNDLINWGGLAGDGTIALSGNTAPTGVPAYVLTYTVASPTYGHWIVSVPSVQGTANMTFSMYMRYVNHQWARLAVYSTSNATNQFRVWIDLVNKTLGTQSAGGTATLSSSSIQDVGNGWVRVTITGNASWSSTSDGAILATTAVADNNATRQGNGAAIEMSSAIFERTSVTSPQPWESLFSTTGASYFGPRFDYDTNGNTPRGVFVEESRTNLAPNYLTIASINQGSQATGSNFFGTPSVRVTYDGSSAGHFATYSNLASAPSASTAHTLSVYVKRVSGGNLIQLTSSTSIVGAVTDYVNFDLSNGTVVGSGGTVLDSYILNCGNGIYRLSMGFTTTASPSAATPCILAAITSSGDTRVPTNTSSDVFECFGAQLEVGRGATSLIPTYGVSATRGADTLYAASAGWLNTTLGTMYADAVRSHVVNGNGSTRIFFTIRADANNYQHILIGSTTNSQHRFDVGTGGVVQAAIQLTAAATAFTRLKMVGLYAVNNGKGCQNGGSVSTDASMTVPSTPNNIGVGSTGSGSYLNGWVREIRYYADASASNAQLQTLTT